MASFAWSLGMDRCCSKLGNGSRILIRASEPVYELRRVPIVECGEALVDYLEFEPKLVFDRPRFKYRRESLARIGVAERLSEAVKRLPPGYNLGIIEGWRPPHIQRRLYLATWKLFKERHPEWSDASLKRVVNRFTAPLGTKVPPPHSTGGAIDLVLLDDTGQPYDHNSPFEAFDPRGFAFDSPGISAEARKTRLILKGALEPTGLTNYPSEYWHWSYGDQGWAYRGGHNNAIYGPIEPEYYVPDPEDLVDTPVERA